MSCEYNYQYEGLTAATYMPDYAGSSILLHGSAFLLGLLWLLSLGLLCSLGLLGRRCGALPSTAAALSLARILLGWLLLRSMRPVARQAT